jgi:PTS system mannitol-specific IIA component
MTAEILTKETVRLNAEVNNQEDAIELAGRLLVEKGCVEEPYIEAMFEREKSVSTYMGNGVAIPHGTEESKRFVKQSGISVLQVPHGVEYGEGNTARLIIGIAGKNDEHLEILSNIALVCADESKVEQILQASTEEELMAFFEEEFD